MPGSSRSPGIRSQPGGEPRRHGKAVAGRGDRRLEQVAPGELAVFLVGEFQHRQDAGHADRDAGGDGLAIAERLAVAIEEHRRRGAGRRRLAAVVDGDGLGRAVVVQQEAAAADARGVRLDDAQHHLHGDGRIDRGAAAPQHFQTGLDGQRMGRRHHRLRRRQDGRHAAGRHQQQRRTASRRPSFMRGAPR